MSKLDRNTHSGFAHIIFLILVIVGVIVFIIMRSSNVIAPYQSSETIPLQSSIPTIKTTPTSDVNNAQDESEKIEYQLFKTSPNNKYSLNLAPIMQEWNRDINCYYILKDENGAEVPLSDVFGQTIKCHPPGEGGIFLEQLVSLQDDGLVIEKPLGTIIIYRFSTGKSYVYSYENASMKALNVNKNFTRWVFSFNSSDANHRSFKILDENHNQLSEFSIEHNDRPILYDEVNDGFLFISRNYFTKEGKDYVETSFDYFDNENNKLTNLLKTKPVTVIGRGCFPEQIVPAVDEIVLLQGCLTVPKNIIGVDNNIHIPL